MENSKLKQIRAKLHENQDVFAKRLGITQSYYSAIERGEKAITAKVLEKLFKDVGVSTQWWYSSKGDIFSSVLSGDSVGAHVGVKKNAHVEIDWVHRIQAYMKREHPDDYKLFKDFLLVSNFQGFIEEFEREIIRPLWVIEEGKKALIEQGKFGYKDYRVEFLKTLQERAAMKPAIFKLSSAIRQFYSDFRPFDKENLIEDYYEEGE